MTDDQITVDHQHNSNLRVQQPERSAAVGIPATKDVEAVKQPEKTRIPAPNTNRAKVYQTIIDLDEHGRKPTKQAVADLTGLTPASVADSMDALYDCGLIRRVYDGVWEPVDQSPDRVVSTSMLPKGRLKVELGDEVLTLTPREALALAKMMVGVLMAFRVTA